MIDIKYITTDPSLAIHRLRLRNSSDDPSQLVCEIIDLNKKRTGSILEIEKYRKKRNELSRKIGKLHSNNVHKTDYIKMSKRVSLLKTYIAQLENKLKEYELKIQKLTENIPNLLDETVPFGKSEKDNLIVRTWGEKREFNFAPKDHVTLGTNLGIIDLPGGAKLTGTGFPIYKGNGAKLERALIQFMLDIHTNKNGYEEIWVPFMVNRDTMRGTGQLPKFEEDLFWLVGGKYGLIPTAEVPLTNYHKNEILSEDDFPKYYTAYSPCFRQEAGQHGEETRGLIRVHQFNKVELVKISHPKTSFDELEKLTRNAEEILEMLKLPYRKVLLCSSDTGFAAAKTYDLEVWLPSQNKYREISSCSNCTDFQARRMKLRFKDRDKKNKFAHTLNGSGLAVGRTWVAIIENYQQSDGSIVIPEMLRSYMSGLEVIKKVSKQIL